jgi:GNAT superfamily N-acetyltransferase
MEYRNYNPTKDRDAVVRIWREIGWIKEGKEEMVDLVVGADRAFVADINGDPECAVSTIPGAIRYLSEDLPFCGVGTVATSPVARKQGLGKRVTAHALAVSAAEGALVAGLGMFEQGYYNQVGFGTGGYEHTIAFDPARLTVRATHRVPRRVEMQDWEMLHAVRLSRLRGHGSVNLHAPKMTRAQMMERDNGFGFGYYDGGELSHCFWCWAQNREYGPYRVAFMAYHSPDQFLELMALIKSMGDQVRLVRMREPQGIQLQDLLDKPFRDRRASYRGDMESGMTAVGFWQMRICDLLGCLERTHLLSGDVRFNLSLSDPVERYLDEDAPWRGVGGEYVVSLGTSSGAERGVDSSLPTLTATVNAFTRLWLGVRPATGLAVTDDLDGPPELLEALDSALRLPDPKPDWDF